MPDINEVASTLGIKPRVLSADIKELAWLWEEAMEDVQAMNPLAAMDTLNPIVKAYLRGKGIRMGNWQGIWRHCTTKAHVARLVILQASQECELFKRLSACGVGSLDDFLTEARRLSCEREELQERVAEDQKADARRRVDELVRKRWQGQPQPYDILEDVKRMVDRKGDNSNE